MTVFVSFSDLLLRQRGPSVDALFLRSTKSTSMLFVLRGNNKRTAPPIRGSGPPVLRLSWKVIPLLLPAKCWGKMCQTLFGWKGLSVGLLTAVAELRVAPSLSRCFGGKNRGFWRATWLDQRPCFGQCRCQNMLEGKEEVEQPWMGIMAGRDMKAFTFASTDNQNHEHSDFAST